MHKVYAFLGLSLFVLAGCGKRETPVESGIRTGTLHVGNSADPQSLDPHVTTGELEFRIQSALFEGLLIPDPVTGEPSPGVASHWDISDDQRIYTFHLRPEAKWSDGKPVTAQDFVDSYRRALTPALAAEAAIRFHYIVGAKFYNEGEKTDFTSVGIETLDDHTLQITLIHPIPHLLKLAMSRPWLPVRVDVIEKFGRIDQRGTAWARPGNLVGNGPFVLKEWRQNEVIVVEKSPTFWDAENVKLNQIYFYPIENSNSEEQAFRSGRLHISSGTNSVPLSRLDYYRNTQPNHLWLKPYGRNHFLLINPQIEPLTDKRVRKALSLVLDREALAENVMQSTWTPSYNLVPQGMDGYKAEKQFEADSETARKLLADAGYPEGKGFPTINLVFPPRGENSRVTEAIQERWRTELGITVSLLQMEWKVWLDALKQGDYHISMDGWNMNNAHQFFQLFVTGNQESYYFWSNAVYDQLFDEATRAMIHENRFQKYDQMEKLLAEEAPMIPLSVALRSRLKHPSVKGWYENPYDNRPWKAIYLEAVD